MSRRIGRWMLTSLLAACTLLGARRAEAHLIFTSPPEAVLPHASHVVRVKLPLTADGFTVETVYRGILAPGPLVVHGMSDYVGPLLRSNEIPGGFLSSEPGSPAGALILALYAMDGRYYVVGRHPAHGVAPHSSVWVLSKEGVAHRYQQVMNPGWPVPTPVGQEDFARHFDDLLLAHPFEGPRHRPLPEVERDAFLALVEPTVDWYGRDLVSRDTKAAPRLALARKLATYAETAPDSMALHIFDMLTLLTDANYAAQDHQAPTARLLLALVKKHGVEAFADPILLALDKQPYGTGDRGILLWVLKETDADLYAKGVEVLRALCRRQMHNEAVDAYWALKVNGETSIVKEIDAVWAAMDAAAGRTPPAEATAPGAEAASTAAASPGEPVAEPSARLRPRIETGEAVPEAPGAEPVKASGSQDDAALPIVPVLVALALAALLSALVFRRR